MSSAEKKRRWKLILNILTIVALVGLAYAIRHQIVDTIHNLAKVNVAVLLLILPIEAWNYDAYAKMYRSFFRILGNETTYKDMYKVALELNMVNHIFPTGGVSGFSYFGIRLRSLGIGAGKATLVQTMRFIFLFITYEALLILGLFMLAIGGKANSLVILVSGSLATLMVVGTVGLAFIIESEKRINGFFTAVTKGLNRIIHLIRPKHPETISVASVQATFNELHENYMLLKKDWRQLKSPLISAFFANLTELLVIYIVYVAFGYWVNPGAVILAYAVANFAGLISVLPGGVGIYEALMTAVLATAGIPPAISLPVTVMYRVLNTAIQVIPGYYFYHKALTTQNRNG
jgi:uncharacterized protein (TIRG00374 family)